MDPEVEAGAELGRLLDICDESAGGDSNDRELEDLRNALDFAVGLLVELGVEIPRESA